MNLPVTDRRAFLKWLSASGLVACAPPLRAKSQAHVIVVGGGFGGATAAKYLRKFNPGLSVTLIEPHKELVTCPFSNWVIGGLRDIGFITHSYDKLVKHWGIKLLHDRVAGIDGEKKTVRLAGGGLLSYDRLIVSPGIDLDYDAIEGYGPGDTEAIPHAYQAAGEQTLNLRRQLEAMSDGGVFIISVPLNPYRCPAAPYERASLVANYFRRRKPRSKVILLDAKSRIPEQAHFYRGWKEFYQLGEQNAMLEFVPGPDGAVVSVDAKTRTVLTGEWEEEHKADVLNIIPPNKAGKLASGNDLTDDSGWCPVDPVTAESSLIPGIHVIGDAADMSPLPKSAYGANTQAKNCAVAVINLLEGRPPPQLPGWMNTCYSMISDHHAVSIMRRYKLEKGKIVSVKGGGASPYDTDHVREVSYALSWYRNMMYDTLG